MICAGIDAGSRAIKAVLYDATSGKVLAAGVRDQGVDQEALARALFEKLYEPHRNGQDLRVVATGYGRQLIGFADKCVTEITCHARGVHYLCPEARCIFEIGGQDSKVMHLDAAGRVRNFAMNDRCAAGTGRFLEVVATRLNAKLDELGGLASKSEAPAAISSMCVVFAETEIIGLLASGVRRGDIVAGVLDAIARRVRALAGGSIQAPVVFTGGVAMLPCMVDALSAATGQPIRVAPRPHYTGALGAALEAAKIEMPTRQSRKAEKR